MSTMVNTHFCSAETQFCSTLLQLHVHMWLTLFSNRGSGNPPMYPTLTFGCDRISTQWGQVPLHSIEASRNEDHIWGEFIGYWHHHSPGRTQSSPQISLRRRRRKQQQHTNIKLSITLMNRHSSHHILPPLQLS